MMERGRRSFLKMGAGAGVYAVLLAAGVLRPDTVSAAQQRAAFEATSLQDAFAALGANERQNSNELVLTVPDIAENGAQVPVGLASRLPNTEQLVVLIEKNPRMVAASFTFPEGTLPEVQTRVKMGESSNVWLLARADGRFYVTRKEVRVTLGGCSV